MAIWDTPNTIERTPLSKPNDQDEDEEGSFVPYSDRSPAPSNGNKASSEGNQTKRNGIIVIEEDDEPKRRTSEFSVEYRKNGPYDDEYGDLFYDREFGASKRRKHYRTCLICEYIRYCCENRVIRRISRMLLILVVMFIMIVSAGGIGFILSQDGSPFGPDGSDADGGSSSKKSGNGKVPKFVPPSPNLHNICSDWVTMTGRQNCQKNCDNSLCCSLPETDKDSCWKDHVEDCATYRSGCMALELHSSVTNGAGDTEVDEYTDTDAQDASVGTGLGSLSSEVELPQPPADLADICSVASLSTPEGFTYCSDICRPSRCCNPNLYECQLKDEESKSYCSLYEEPCKSVAETWRGSGHGEVGSMDGNFVANYVMLQCNSANLNPPDSCIEACSAGACCYVSTTYPPIEQLFDKHFGTDKNPMKNEVSCSSNIGFCQQYGSCEHLNNIKDVSGWESDDLVYELNIDSVCMTEYIAKNGALSCSNVCQPAHCCFSQGQTCVGSQLNDLNCDDYAQCKVLYPTHKDLTELLHLAEHIDEVCSDALNSLKSRSECQDQCKGHLCCFDDGASGCSNDVSQNCLAYAGCEVLVETPKSKLQNDNQGSSTTITTATSKQIDQSPDKVPITTINKDPQKGDGGSSSNNIADATDKPVEPSHPNEVVHSDPSSTEFIQLEEVCNNHYMKLKGVEQCKSLCDPFECCFQDDSNCDDKTVIHCSRVSLCRNYFVPQEEGVGIEKQCSKEVMEEDPDTCIEICEPYNCCFTDKQCSEHISANCDLYNPCKILLDDNSETIQNTSTEAVVDIGEMCSSSVSDKDWDTCVSHCEPYRCCFARGSACHVEKQLCDEYDYCTEFFDDGEGSMTAADPTLDTMPSSKSTAADPIVDLSSSSDPVVDPLSSFESTPETLITEANLEELCSPSKLIENWDTCISYCEQYKCCFENNDSCDKTKTQCGNHSICAQFFAKTVGSGAHPEVSTTSSSVAPEEPESDAKDDESPSYIQYTAVELAKACNSKQLAKDASDCKMLCRGSACCFSSFSSSNCFERQKSFCHDHAICESLFDR